MTLYLLFAFLFLAFLSESGNAQRWCHRRGGRCFSHRCLQNFENLGKIDCRQSHICCRPNGAQWKIMPSPSSIQDVFKIWPMT
ncbi:PREDICTED: crotamine CRO3-like [Thamnophis sirtalis]|uniref:Crotamine CRO3-like n=1 Tax=Thamnophis sirtalis TaxID=35019 RepID=A0A6I9X9W7_9SAUR|nr:PREDICTED: crotamine CRO3-like [Thamnophis sirtalis]